MRAFGSPNREKPRPKETTASYAAAAALRASIALDPQRFGSEPNRGVRHALAVESQHCCNLTMPARDEREPNLSSGQQLFDFSVREVQSSGLLGIEDWEGQPLARAFGICAG